MTGKGTATTAGTEALRRALEGGLSLFEAGAVEMLGDDAGLVKDGTMRFYADGCGCGTHEERGGVACGHMLAVRHPNGRTAA